MANKDDDASATGCGCLIILAVLGFGIYKLVNWASANQGTVESFWQMAKKVGLIALVLIVIWFVMLLLLIVNSKYGNGRISYHSHKTLTY